MDITRRAITTGVDGRPITSYAVARADTVYLSGGLAEPWGDIRSSELPWDKGGRVDGR